MFVLELCVCFIDELTSEGKSMFETFIPLPVISVSGTHLLFHTLFFAFLSFFFFFLLKESVISYVFKEICINKVLLYSTNPMVNHKGKE